jgi:hypothetical protein
MGTVDEARWPQLGLDLAHPTFVADGALTRKILGIELGDRVDVTGLPSWLPPFPVRAVVQGYTETIKPLTLSERDGSSANAPFSYKIVWNCTPYSPYRVGLYTDYTARFSNDNTVLAGTMTTTSTSRTMTINYGPLWTTTAGDFPFDILVAGEQMTVTNITGTSSPQTFTVTRSVNGVVKAHSAGESVQLYDPVYYGL